MIPILKHYSDIVSGILSGSKWHIYSKILSDIPSGIYFVIASGILSASILTCFLAYILTFSLASHKAFSDIHSIWRLVAMCPLLSRARGWGAGGRGEGEGEGAVIKSRNPLLEKVFVQIILNYTTNYNHKWPVRCLCNHTTQDLGIITKNVFIGSFRRW